MLGTRFLLMFCCGLMCASNLWGFDRVKYNHPGLEADLSVGLWAWPMPMDWDGDGDLDLVVSCPDVPYNGTYVFENPGGDAKLPVFRPAVRVGPGMHSIQVSYVDGKPRVLTPATEWVDFLGGSFDETRSIFADKNVHTSGRKIRANQWRYVDYDGNGAYDLIVGVGDWTDYGWDDAFNDEGKWTNGPLHGYVYLLLNSGTTEEPAYGEPKMVTAGDEPVDVYGMPTPNFADFDGDGDLDLLCGEFLDGFTYFRNDGTRTEPRYVAGVRPQVGGEPLRMNLQMITPTAVDWDRDGDVDLVVGDEDGRVAFIEHTGEFDGGVPQFLAPRYFRQQADDLKFGALVTPVGVDWDGDGDEDLVCGNSAGHLAWIENLDGGSPPKWAEPKLFQADGQPLRPQAGTNGSIQGPAEAKWGYTTLSVADWDHDGRKDLIVNSIWGRVVWYRRIGDAPDQFEPERPVVVDWNGSPPYPAWNWWKPGPNELVTQWRTTPVAIDLNQDGLTDLVSLDHEGYLSFYERVQRDGELRLSPGKRIFTDPQGKPLQLNDGKAGRSGRRKLCLADWDGDGRLDLLVNSRSVDLYRNVSTPETPWAFASAGPVHGDRLAGHTTSPTVVDWNADGRPDLVAGAEDGRFYYLENNWREPARKEFSGVTVEGHGIHTGTVADGQTAFTNRDYTWAGVPPELAGRRFLMTAGGEGLPVSLIAQRATTIYVASSTPIATREVPGRRPESELSFRYTDRGRTRLHVYRKELTVGERLSIPPVGWTGTVVILPSDAD